MDKDTVKGLSIVGLVAGLAIVFVLGFIHVAVTPLFGQTILAEDLQKCHEQNGHLNVLWISSQESYYVQCDTEKKTVFEYTGKAQ